MTIFFRYALVAMLSFVASAAALDLEAFYQDADTAYEAKDYETALSKMTALAVLGDARAQNYVGYMHAFAKGTIKDPEKSVQWYCHAALQGHAKAMFNIGRMLVDGTAGQIDLETANGWYQQAARLGDPAAQVNLGMNLLDGDGTGENPAEAYKWLSIGLQNAQDSTGLAHDYLGDAERALTPEQLAAQKSVVQAWIPATFGAWAKGVSGASKPCEGLDMDLKPLTFNKGSEALRHEDYELAYTLFKTLADEDHAPSQRILAEMYEKGQGRDKNAAEASTWYCRAAGQGDQEALWRLAALNPQDAQAFNTIGAHLGDTRAQLTLGREAISTDPVKAYMWLSVASNENLDESGEAEELFDQVRSQVTREQKIQGINLAADFWPVQFNDDMAAELQATQVCSGN